MDDFCSLQASHKYICRPENRMSSQVEKLTNFIMCILEREKARISRETASSIPPFQQGDIVGLQKPLKVVQEKLQKSQLLALVGVDGSGKTALAISLFHQIHKEYDHSCFVEGVKKKVGSKVTRRDLMNFIIRHLLPYRNEKSPEEKHWTAVQGKKVLLMLDGVDSLSEEFLKFLNGDFAHFSHSSHLIVTSRNQSFLRKLDFELHKVTLLNDRDSSQLLCKYAFKSLVAPAEFEGEVKALVSTCGGLPLALKEVGRYLYKQEQKVLWEEVLSKLKGGNPPDGSGDGNFWPRLRLGFDGLERKVQDMFLDVATCFHGMRVVDAKAAWKALGLEPESGWLTLMDMCLVAERERSCSYSEEKEKVVWMQDLLRILGKSIARGRKHLRVLEDQKALQFLGAPSNQVLREMAEVKIMKVRSGPELFHLGPLGKLHQLRVLFVKERVLCVGCMDSKAGAMSSLFMERCSFADPKLPCNASDVTERAAPSSDISPEAVLQSHPLRHLFSENCDWWFFKYVPQLLVHLKGLQHMTVRNCSLRSNKTDFGEKKLALQKRDLPGALVGNFFIDTLPEFLGNLKQLQDLTLRGYPSVRCLPESIGQLKSLQRLTIGHFRSLHQLPDSLGELVSLQHLSISCLELKRLPESLGQLRQLQHLSINDCCALKNLPESLGNLGSLQQLELTRLMRLSSLPESFGGLTKLYRLIINDCSLNTLPESFGQLKALKELIIRTATNLIAFPRSFDQLEELDTLTISDCWMLDSLPDSFGKLTALRQMTMEAVPMSELPESFGQLTALEHLTLRYCWSLKKLPKSFFDLQALRQLNIHSLRTSALPLSFGELRALKSKTISNCW